MGKFPKIDRLEYMYFYDGMTSLQACRAAIEKRYKDSNLNIPHDIKLILWVVDICFNLLSQHLKFVQDLRKENVHKSDNY